MLLLWFKGLGPAEEPSHPPAEPRRVRLTQPLIYTGSHSPGFVSYFISASGSLSRRAALGVILSESPAGESPEAPHQFVAARLVLFSLNLGKTLHKDVSPKRIPSSQKHTLDMFDL